MTFKTGGLLGAIAAGLLLAGSASVLGQGALAQTGGPVVAAPAISPAIRQALAPTGKLRVGVYNGGPTSMVRLPSGERAGLAYSLGTELGRRLGVPVEVVEFDRVALVVDGLKAGTVDFSVTNATPARVKDIDFTDPIINLELSYLVPPGSPVTSIDTVDRPGVRVGVLAGSTTIGALSAVFKNAKLVTATSLEDARDLIASHKVDAYATNKSNLFALSDQIPQSKVLDGHWGFEHMGMGVPKGRDVGFAYVRAFAQEVLSSGLVAREAKRAGLRGAVGLS